MFTLQEILEAADGKLVSGLPKGRVNGVGIDSRIIQKDELFIAIKGDQFDGHDFVSEVEKLGVRFFVVHKSVQTRNSGSRVILVKDTTKALGHLARYHRLRFDIPVIGITGSAGKTTTKELIAAVLKTKFNVLANEGTQNNHIGVPLTLLKLRWEHQAAVIEMGTNQPGDIAWLAAVAAPSMAVLMNIGESHLEKLKSLNGVFVEKMNLARAIPKEGHIILNADDQYLRTAADKKLNGNPVVFSILRKSGFQARNVRTDPRQGTLFEVNNKRFLLRTFSDQMTYNALAAIVCGNLLGVSMSDIVKAIRRFRFSRGRQEVFKQKGLVIFNDTYNANPVSMRCAVRTLDAYPAKGRRILVCADMLELGAQTRKAHVQIGECVSQSKVDVLITIGENAKIISTTAQTRRSQLIVFHFSEMESLKNYLSVLCQKGDAILVKGSRRMKMESVVQELLNASRN